MADALSELSGYGPVDPDAQATITDFHDYSEFFPSDLARSLTLIGKLDEEYNEDTDRIHALTKTYGALPTVPLVDRTDPKLLRRDISRSLDHALRARAASVAEATRLCNVADTLYNRLVGIKKKLAAMPRPPSRESSPVAVKARSPQTTRTRKSEAERPKITLNPPSTAAIKNATAAAREKKRSRRVIVPGEVLPPFDPNSPLDTDFSSSEDELPPPSPVRTPAALFRLSEPNPSTSSKLPKIQKTPKAPKIRPPGQMGTNVHSTVAGISVSNAMATLTPPPPDAQPGSEWQPWLTLTEWELNMLRRRMKKNANWKPSETMTRRELKDRNRGPEAFARARAEAEANGTTVLNEPAHKFSNRDDELVPVDANASGTMNVGMKLNAQKKAKREADGILSAVERGEPLTDDFMAQITAAGQNVAALYNQVSPFNGSSVAARSPDDGKKVLKSSRKRKRDRTSVAGADGTGVEGDPVTPIKKLKLVASSKTDMEGADSINDTVTTLVPLAPEGPSTPPAAKHLEVDGNHVTAASSRPSRTPRMLTPAPKAEDEDASSNFNGRHVASHSASPYSAPNPSTSRPRPSRGITSITLKLTQKAASAEPPHQRHSRRRASETALLQQDHADSKGAAPTAASSRGKRSAPGMTVGGEEGGAKLSLTRRKNDPARKRGGATNEPMEDIDPNEPTYCTCNNVSWGTMVACENPSCPTEWFHLACVGLEQPPGKRQRWWCPDCRKKLGVGQFGEKRK